MLRPIRPRRRRGRLALESGQFPVLAMTTLPGTTGLEYVLVHGSILRSWDALWSLLDAGDPTGRGLDGDGCGCHPDAHPGRGLPTGGLSRSNDEVA
jgi:hypothetical protein